MIKQTLQLVAVAGVLCLTAATVRAQQSLPPGTEEYKLVWADEFNVDGPPDPTNWNFEHGFIRNEEAQWYQPENARCENGLLVISARREQVKNPNYDPSSSSWKLKREHADYTSTCVTTSGLHEWLYGRFEMRARIDTRSGLWPAFWCLGSGPWPACGEVDIMEYYRNELLANVGWAGKTLTGKPSWNASTKKVSSFHEGWASQFHVWRMDWDEKAIKLYVDGQLLNQQALSKTINVDAQKTNPFHQPKYILLNLAIGGQDGGDPSKTQFPAKFEIDYVRVYQKGAY